MKLKPFVLSAFIYWIILFFYYGTNYAITNALTGLSMFERVTTLTTVSRAILAGSELFYVGLFMTIYFITNYFYGKK